MNFLSLVELYCDINVYNPRTRTQIFTIGSLFEKRGAKNINEFSLESVLRFKRECLQVCTTTTFNSYLRYLRLVGDFAMNEGIIEENFFKTLKPAPLPKLLPKVLDDDNLAAVITFFKNNPDRFNPSWFWLSVINTLYWTGIRRRQLTHLKLADLDFHNDKIHLTHKGSKTLREWEIPMHPVLKTDLLKYVEKFEKATGQPLRLDNYLFAAHRVNELYVPDHEDDQRMNPESITRFFKKLSRLSGIRIGANRFRHTIATKICNPEDGNPDIFSAQALLGHASIRTTKNYVHTPIDSIRKAINKINGIK